MSMSMPSTLKLVVVVLVAAAGANLLAGSLLTAGLLGAGAIGVAIGNGGVRSLLRAAAALQIAHVAIVALLEITGVLPGDGSSIPMIAITRAVAIAMPAYLLWALGQDEVRQWMLRRVR